MSKTSIQKKEYKGWNNCIEMSNGIIDLIVTTDVGPRIMRFGFVGKNNELYEDNEQIGKSGGNQWIIYGGHRLWHSPETHGRTYEPDNNEVKWERTEQGIKLIQSTEPNARIRKEIEITMLPDEANVTVLHRLVNEGLWPVQFSAWAITMLAPGGKEFIPNNKRDTGLVPNNMISVWPYTRLNDKRIVLDDEFVIVAQDKSMENPLKIGVPNESGWAVYVNNDHAFIKRYKHIQGAQYPDLGVSYETYTNHQYLEMETLSPLKLVEPGGCIEHAEEWYLLDGMKLNSDETNVDRIVKSF